MRPFRPVLKNPHLLTILGNFWPRKYDWSAFPVETRFVQTVPDTQVLVQSQRPTGESRGEVVLLHGLEGGGEAGYMRSMAWSLLNAGFAVHRLHMRTCGGTESLAKTLYHAGLTSDLLFFLQQLRTGGAGPLFLVGFSLGGNVALKLAGELGETDLIAGVCAISTPLDLAAGVRRIQEVQNRLYHRRFVQRMRKRLMATGRYSEADLNGAHSLYEIDDRVTAPSFGFNGADDYYATQSSQVYLERIRVPTLLLQAKDDVFIPFESYRHPAIAANPSIKLIVTEYGGHLEFLSKDTPRFWADEVAVEFLTGLARGEADVTVNAASRSAR